MNLPDGDQGPDLSAMAGTELTGEQSAIALDILAGIGCGEAKIQGLATVNFRKAAESGAEAMYQPRQGAEDVSPNDLEFLGRFTFDELGHKNILVE